jgi:hypothetical protein
VDLPLTVRREPLLEIVTFLFKNGFNVSFEFNTPFNLLMPREQLTFLTNRRLQYKIAKGELAGNYRIIQNCDSMIGKVLVNENDTTLVFKDMNHRCLSGNCAVEMMYLKALCEPPKNDVMMIDRKLKKY